MNRHLLKWLKKKKNLNKHNLTIPHAGEDAEQLECSYVMVGTQMMCF